MRNDCKVFERLLMQIFGIDIGIGLYIFAHCQRVRCHRKGTLRVGPRSMHFCPRESTRSESGPSARGRTQIPRERHVPVSNACLNTLIINTHIQRCMFWSTTLVRRGVMMSTSIPYVLFQSRALLNSRLIHSTGRCFYKNSHLERSTGIYSHATVFTLVEGGSLERWT